MATSEARVVFSDRVHRFPLRGAHLELHRALSPTWLVRHCAIRGLVQDERLTADLGPPAPAGRARIAVILDGHSVAFVAGQVLTLQAGDLIWLPHADRVVTRAGDVETLELEVGDDCLDHAVSTTTGTTRLQPLAWRTAVDLVAALRTAGPDRRHRFSLALTTFLHALAAQGLHVHLEPASTVGTVDERLMGAIDVVLSDVAASPMSVDLESRLAMSRRTLGRHIPSLTKRYSLDSVEGASWRDIRDGYRRAVAAILLSHDDGTPSAVARLVGYGSLEALDHAFRQAGLSSPIALRTQLR